MADEKGNWLVRVSKERQKGMMWWDVWWLWATQMAKAQRSVLGWVLRFLWEVMLVDGMQELRVYWIWLDLGKVTKILMGFWMDDL